MAHDDPIPHDDPVAPSGHEDPSAPRSAEEAEELRERLDPETRARRDAALRHVRKYGDPVLEWKSDETEAMDEGCLSLPGVLVPVDRPVEVRVTGRDEHGEPLRIEA